MPTATATAVRAAVLLALLVVALAACGGADGTATNARSDSVGATTTAAAATAAGGDVEPVAVEADGVTLRGDLRLPTGEEPHPAVVLVHGSGPLDRDGEVPGQLAMAFPTPVAVLAELAEGLRAAGYAVLTYDKRSCGPFNGCADNGYPTPDPDVTVDVFAADALAAVEHLRDRPDIATGAVAVAGHSQGATLVPAMLLDDPDLAAGVMASAPYDPVDDLLADQAATVERLVASLDPAPPTAVQAIAQVRELAADVGELRGGDTGDDAQVAGATAGFWRSWLRVSDGVPQLAQQAPQPILVVSGGADTNVRPRQTAKWRQIAGDGLQVEEVACVSHALNCLGTDDPAAVQPDAIAAHVDPRVVAAIAAFLDDELR